MAAIDHLVPANQDFARGFSGPPEKFPAQKLAVLTCMDTRLDVLPVLGLHVGDVHVLRNAGGLPTDDALRSLAISQRALRTTEIAVILHTECGMNGFDDDAFRAEVSAECGTEPASCPGFTDVHEATRQAVEQVRACAFIPHRDQVRGYVYDVATASITEVE